MREVPVLIVGGGPIGLALACDLGRRGIETLLVEKREDRMGSPKMIQVSVRTLEFCRSLGLSEAVRNWGFPHDHNMDSVFVTTLGGFELGRVHVPTIADAPCEAESPERDIHCPQTWFDPILQRCARSFAHVSLRYQTELVTFDQDDEGVTAVLDDRANGTREKLRAHYLIGADGYTSTVRALLGIAMRGEQFLDLSMSVYVRIPGLLARHTMGDAYRYVFLGSDGVWGVLTTIDGFDSYRFQIIGSNERDVKSIDAPAALRRAIGDDVPFEIVEISLWARKMVVADRFSDGRVFLAGDAAHAHPPNGGLGMNTGIGDAFDLGWKLASTFEGWGGPALLASYDVERRPASSRAAAESLNNYHRLTRATRHPHIEEESHLGVTARAALGARLVAENEKSWHPLGVHLGYLYDPSPVIVPDGSERPSDDPIEYVPTTFPGARAPHVWLSPGRSTLDLFGDGFALLAFGTADATPLEREARAQGVPLTVTRIDDPSIAARYERPLVLVRPDGHVAWRGHRADDGSGIIETVRGAGPRIAARRSPMRVAQVS